MRNCPYGFEIYLVKTMRTIAQIFVAFSEKLNFKIMAWQWYRADGSALTMEYIDDGCGVASFIVQNK